MKFRVYGGSLSDCGWSPISISTPPSLDTYPARVGSNLSCSITNQQLPKMTI